jgi:hypothetical protein
MVTTPAPGGVGVGDIWYTRSSEYTAYIWIRPEDAQSGVYDGGLEREARIRSGGENGPKSEGEAGGSIEKDPEVKETI